MDKRKQVQEDTRQKLADLVATEDDQIKKRLSKYRTPGLWRLKIDKPTECCTINSNK